MQKASATVFDFQLQLRKKVWLQLRTYPVLLCLPVEGVVGDVIFDNICDNIFDIRMPFLTTCLTEECYFLTKN